MNGNRTIDNDPATSSSRIEDRWLDLQEWNRRKGELLAAKEDIRLTEMHWEVIDFLRGYYLRNGRARSGRELAEALDRAFVGQGGRKFLYRLFPDGPVSQGSRIAGLPEPRYSADGSFGSFF
jgi:TusE/DsrC/DsvC family sulfur relay protein